MYSIETPKPLPGLSVYILWCTEEHPLQVIRGGASGMAISRLGLRLSSLSVQMLCGASEQMPPQHTSHRQSSEVNESKVLVDGQVSKFFPILV